MLFKVLKGFDAIACASRLYNAGLCYFKYPPHDLTTAGFTNWVFLMSQLNVGPGSPEQWEAFDGVIKAAAKNYGDVLVRETTPALFNMGRVIPVNIPADSTKAGIIKFISGSNAADCAAMLLGSGLISSSDQSDGRVKITSQPELRPDIAEQSQAFDIVVRTVAETFADARVSDPP